MSNPIVKSSGMSTTANLNAGNMNSFIAKLVKTKMFDQLCLLVLDGSGSMNMRLEDGQTKAGATAEGAKSLAEFLKRSTRSSGFHLAIICYSNNTQIRLYPQPVDNLELSQIVFDPMEGLGDNTMIGKALAEAEKMAKSFLNNQSVTSKLSRSVRIILMSDGYPNDPKEAISVAESIKNSYSDTTMRLCTCFLGNENDEEHWRSAEAFMKSLASTDRSNNQFFTKSHSGAELRNFLEKSSTEE